MFNESGLLAQSRLLAVKVVFDAVENALRTSERQRRQSILTRKLKVDHTHYADIVDRGDAGSFGGVSVNYAAVPLLNTQPSAPPASSGASSSVEEVGEIKRSLLINQSVTTGGAVVMGGGGISNRVVCGSLPVSSTSWRPPSLLSSSTTPTSDNHLLKPDSSTATQHLQQPTKKGGKSVQITTLSTEDQQQQPVTPVKRTVMFETSSRDDHSPAATTTSSPPLASHHAVNTTTTVKGSDASSAKKKKHTPYQTALEQVSEVPTSDGKSTTTSDPHILDHHHTTTTYVVPLVSSSSSSHPNGKELNPPPLDDQSPKRVSYEDGGISTGISMSLLLGSGGGVGDDSLEESSSSACPPPLGAVQVSIPVQTITTTTTASSKEPTTTSATNGSACNTTSPSTTTTTTANSTISAVVAPVPHSGLPLAMQLVLKQVSSITSPSSAQESPSSTSTQPQFIAMIKEVSPAASLASSSSSPQSPSISGHTTYGGENSPQQHAHYSGVLQMCVVAFHAIDDDQCIDIPADASIIQSIDTLVQRAKQLTGGESSYSVLLDDLAAAGWIPSEVLTKTIERHIRYHPHGGGSSGASRTLSTRSGGGGGVLSHSMNAFATRSSSYNDNHYKNSPRSHRSLSPRQGSHHHIHNNNALQSSTLSSPRRGEVRIESPRMKDGVASPNSNNRQGGGVNVSSFRTTIAYAVKTTTTTASSGSATTDNIGSNASSGGALPFLDVIVVEPWSALVAPPVHIEYLSRVNVEYDEEDDDQYNYTTVTAAASASAYNNNSRAPSAVSDLETYGISRHNDIGQEQNSTTHHDEQSDDDDHPFANGVGINAAVVPSTCYCEHIRRVRWGEAGSTSSSTEAPASQSEQQQQRPSSPLTSTTTSATASNSNVQPVYEAPLAQFNPPTALIAQLQSNQDIAFQDAITRRHMFLSLELAPTIGLLEAIYIDKIPSSNSQTDMDQMLQYFENIGRVTATSSSASSKASTTSSSIGASMSIRDAKVLPIPVYSHLLLQSLLFVHWTATSTTPLVLTSAGTATVHNKHVIEKVARAEVQKAMEGTDRTPRGGIVSSSSSPAPLTKELLKRKRLEREAALAARRSTVEAQLFGYKQQLDQQTPSGMLRYCLTGKMSTYVEQMGQHHQHGDDEVATTSAAGDVMDRCGRVGSLYCSDTAVEGILHHPTSSSSSPQSTTSIFQVFSRMFGGRHASYSVLKSDSCSDDVFKGLLVRAVMLLSYVNSQLSKQQSSHHHKRKKGGNYNSSPALSPPRPESSSSLSTDVLGLMALKHLSNLLNIVKSGIFDTYETSASQATVYAFTLLKPSLSSESGMVVGVDDIEEDSGGKGAYGGGGDSSASMVFDPSFSPNNRSGASATSLIQNQPHLFQTKSGVVALLQAIPCALGGSYSSTIEKVVMVDASTKTHVQGGSGGVPDVFLPALSASFTSIQQRRSSATTNGNNTNNSAMMYELSHSFTTLAEAALARQHSERKALTEKAHLAALSRQIHTNPIAVGYREESGGNFYISSKSSAATGSGSSKSEAANSKRNSTNGSSAASKPASIRAISSARALAYTPNPFIAGGGGGGNISTVHTTSGNTNPSEDVDHDTPPSYPEVTCHTSSYNVVGGGFSSSGESLFVVLEPYASPQLSQFTQMLVNGVSSKQQGRGTEVGAAYRSCWFIFEVKIVASTATLAAPVRRTGLNAPAKFVGFMYPPDNSLLTSTTESHSQTSQECSSVVEMYHSLLLTNLVAGKCGKNKDMTISVSPVCSLDVVSHHHLQQQQHQSSPLQSGSTTNPTTPALSDRKASLVSSPLSHGVGSLGMMLGDEPSAPVSRVSSSKSLQNGGGDGNNKKKHSRLMNTYVIPPTQPSLLISRQVAITTARGGSSSSSQHRIAHLQPISLVLLHPAPSKVVRVVDKCIALTQQHSSYNNNNSNSKTHQNTQQNVFSGAVAGLVNSCITNDDEDHIAVRRKQKASLMWASRKDKEEAAVELTTEKYFNHHLLSIDCSAPLSSTTTLSATSQYDDTASKIQEEGSTIVLKRDSAVEDVVSHSANRQDDSNKAAASGGHRYDDDDQPSVHIYVTDSTNPEAHHHHTTTDDASSKVENSSDVMMMRTDTNKDTSPIVVVVEDDNNNGSPLREQSPSAPHTSSLQQNTDKTYGSIAMGGVEEQVEEEADEDAKYLLHLAHMTDKKDLLDTIINDYMYVLAEEDRLEMKKRELVVEARALLVANPFGDVFPSGSGGTTPTSPASHGNHQHDYDKGDVSYMSVDEVDFYVHTGECKATAVAAIKTHKKVSAQLVHLHAYGTKLLHYMRLLIKRVIGEAGHGGPLTSPATYLEQEKRQRSSIAALRTGIDQDRSVNMGASSSPPSSPTRRRQQQLYSAPSSPSSAPRTPMSVARGLRGAAVGSSGGDGGRQHMSSSSPSDIIVDARRSSVISDTGSIQYASNLTKEQFINRYIQRRQRTLNLLFDDEREEGEDSSQQQPQSSQQPLYDADMDQNVTTTTNQSTSAPRPSSATSSVMFRSNSNTATPAVRTGSFTDDRPGSAQAAARKAVLAQLAKDAEIKRQGRQSTTPLSSRMYGEEDDPAAQSTLSASGNDVITTSPTTATNRPSRTALLPSSRTGSASLSKRNQLPPLSTTIPQSSSGGAKSSSRSVNSSSATTPSNHLKTVGGFYVVKTYPTSTPTTNPINTNATVISASTHDDSVLSSGSLRGQQPASSSDSGGIGGVSPTSSAVYTTPVCAADAPGAVDLWFGRRQLLLKRANTMLTKQRRDLANEAVHSVLDFLQGM